MAKTQSSAWFYWIASEGAFFGFLYYVLFLLKIEGNLWQSALFLWLLMNASIVLCPVVRKCCCK